MGAHTVLGTLLPVSALQAARFLGRLVLRVNEFIPIYTERMDIPLRWSEFISGLQRMSYVTEILDSLKHIGIDLHDSDRERLQLAANNRINPFHDDWYSSFIKNLQAVLCLKRHEVDRFLSSWCQLTESMRYVQLGNPEGIWIRNKSAEKMMSGDMSTPS
jgi:hypothetical protein